MQRKIKFRGRVSQPQYNLSTNENETPFITGSLTINKDSYVIYPTNQTKGYFVDKKTIGQYTGLKDKNGIEIYEGDIIWYNHYDGLTGKFTEIEITLENYAYDILTLQDLLTSEHIYDLTVIGNIHEKEKENEGIR